MTWKASEMERTNRAGWIVTAVLIAGCTNSTQPVAPPILAQQAAKPQTVTFYLAGMNKKLEIM